MIYYLNIGKVPISVIKDFTFGEKCQNYKSGGVNQFLNLPCILVFITEVNINLRKSNASNFTKDAKT